MDVSSVERDHGIWLSTACPPKRQPKAKLSNSRQKKPLSSKIPPRKMMMHGGALSCGFFTQNSPPPTQLLTARKQSSLTDFFRSTAEDKNAELVQNAKPPKSQATHKTEAEMKCVEAEVTCVEAEDINTDVHHSPTKNIYTPAIITPTKKINTSTEMITTPSRKSSTPSTPTKMMNSPIKKVNTPIRKINTPSVNIDLSTNNLNTSSMSIDTPSINIITPSRDINSQTNDNTLSINPPIMSINTPTIDINTPSNDINTPIMSINTPTIYINTPSNDINTPTMSTESPDSSKDEKLFTSDHDKENLGPAPLTVTIKENTPRRKLSAHEWTFCQAGSPQTKKIKLARGVDDDILDFSCQTTGARQKWKLPVLSPLKQTCLTGKLPAKHLANFDSFTLSTSEDVSESLADTAKESASPLFSESSLQLTLAADNQDAVVLQDDKFRRLKEKHMEEMGTLTFTETLL